MNVKAVLSLSLLFAGWGAAGAQLQPIDSLKDVSLYLKPKYDLVRTYDQEFGIQARLVHSGNFYEVTNLCYDPIYPLRFNLKPRYSMGFQFTYTFLQAPVRIGIYTKPKYNLVNLWKQETGLTARLYTSPSLVISSNVAYVWNYPYISGEKPNWLALVNFQFPVGR